MYQHKKKTGIIMFIKGINYQNVYEKILTITSKMVIISEIRNN